MTPKEFTERTNLVPTPEEYAEIEAMYMCARNMDKDEFCLRWKQCGKNPLTKALLKEAKVLNGMLEERNNELEDCHDKMNSLIDFLIGKSVAYTDTDFYREAIKIAGQRTVTLRKIEMSLPLWEEDIEYIKNNLK